MAGKTKHERREERRRAIEEALPPIDAGQFENVEPPTNTHYTIDQVLKAGEAIVKGATLKDAEILYGFTRGALRGWQKDARRAARGRRRLAVASRRPSSAAWQRVSQSL